MEIEIEKEINEIRECYPRMLIPTKETNIGKVILKTNDDNDMCMICRDETNTKISCNHYLHGECVDKWIEKSNHNKCPYCRQEMKQESKMRKVIDWYSISKYQKLSEEFIVKFQNKVNWYSISRKQKLSE